MKVSFDMHETITLPVRYSQTPWQVRWKIRNEYVRLQKGLCYYCNSDLKKRPPKEIIEKPINWQLFPDNFLKYPVHLQHNHNTDMTEGAVHAYCNAVMWQYERR